jgi:hypothetical protein
MANRTVAHANESYANGSGYFTVLITENEPGYYPLASTSATVEEARRYADDLNRSMGFSPETVQQVLVSSMAAHMAGERV